MHIAASNSSASRHGLAVSGPLTFREKNSDGTAGVTAIVAAEFNLMRDINLKLNTVGSNPSQFTTVGLTVYLVATKESHGTELRRSNGTAAAQFL